MKDLPESADLAERKRVLSKVGPDFHGFTSHGRKVWSREVLAYLERHGLPVRTPADAPHKFADDICFPFRSKADV